MPKCTSWWVKLAKIARKETHPEKKTEHCAEEKECVSVENQKCLLLSSWGIVKVPNRIFADLSENETTTIIHTVPV